MPFSPVVALNGSNACISAYVPFYGPNNQLYF